MIDRKEKDRNKKLKFRYDKRDRGEKKWNGKNNNAEKAKPVIKLYAAFRLLKEIIILLKNLTQRGKEKGKGTTVL